MFICGTCSRQCRVPIKDNNAKRASKPVFIVSDVAFMFKNKALAKSLRCLVKSCISSQEIHDLLQNYIKY